MRGLQAYPTALRAGTWRMLHWCRGSSAGQGTGSLGPWRREGAAVDVPRVSWIYKMSSYEENPAAMELIQTYLCVS